MQSFKSTVVKKNKQTKNKSGITLQSVNVTCKCKMLIFTFSVTEMPIQNPYFYFQSQLKTTLIMTNEPYSNSLFFLYLITKPQESIESKLISHHVLAFALEMFVLYLYFLYAYIYWYFDWNWCVKIKKKSPRPKNFGGQSTNVRPMGQIR